MIKNVVYKPEVNADGVLKMMAMEEDDNNMSLSIKKADEILELWFKKQIKCLDKAKIDAHKKIQSEDALHKMLQDAGETFVEEITKKIVDFNLSDTKRESIIYDIRDYFSENFYGDEVKRKLLKVQWAYKNLYQRIEEHKNVVKTLVNCCESVEQLQEILVKSKIVTSSNVVIDCPYADIWSPSELYSGEQEK